MLNLGTIISSIALLGNNIMLYTVVGGSGPLTPVSLFLRDADLQENLKSQMIQQKPPSFSFAIVLFLIYTFIYVHDEV